MGTHPVHFYDDDALLSAEAAAYLGDALARDGGAVVIAAPAHRFAILSRLEAGHGAALAAARASGRFVALDAADALASFVIDGRVDRARFDAEIGGLIDGVERKSPSGPVHVYAELVDALWRDGNARAVLALEEAWSELSRAHPFSLVRGCVSHDRAGLEALRDDHARGLGARAPSPPGDTLRALAAAEQRAGTLEGEIVRRDLAETRMVAVQRTTSALGGAATVGEIVRILVEGVGEAIDARGVAIWLVDDARTGITMVETKRVLAETRARFDRIPLDASPRMPVIDTVVHGATYWFETLDDMVHAGYEELAASLRRESYERVSIGCIPLRAGGPPLGAVSLTIGSRPVDPIDRDYLRVLADAAAAAIVRARLYEAERRGRAEAELLYRLTHAVNAVHVIEEIYELAADAMQIGIGIARVSILLFDEGGVMRFKAWRGLSDDYRAAVEGHSPWKPNHVSPPPIVVEDVERDPA